MIFLVFLILILNVSTFVKLTALLFIYLVRPDFKFGFKTGRLPLFYALMAVFCLLQAFLHVEQWSKNYLFLVALSFGYWCASLLVLHQVKLAVEKKGLESLHRTLQLFFVLNALFSFWNILHIIISTGEVNPYTYEGMSLKYHISTGDWITGLIRDFSLTNCFINLVGVIYFIYRRNTLLATICLVVVLLATSNAVTLLLLGAFAGVIIFNPRRQAKTIALVFTGTIVVFYTKVSPENIDYTVKTVRRQAPAQTVVKYHDTAVTRREQQHLQQRELLLIYLQRKQKHQEVPVQSTSGIERERTINKTIEMIQTKELQNKASFDSTTLRTQDHKNKALRYFVHREYPDSIRISDFPYGGRYPGKLISFLETEYYLTSSARAFILGSGPGAFSSKLAFKASGVGEFGKYPQGYQVLSPTFKENHLKIYCYFFLQTPDKHSVANNPFSAYNQLAGEYGVAGLILFVVFYVAYFFKRFRKLSYGRLLVPIGLIFLATDYWFEHLSVLVIFELVLFLDLAHMEQQHQKSLTDDAS